MIKKGVTTVYNKASKMITRHRSALPGGNNESKVDETVLDCIYDDAKRTYFVLDCLIWKSHPIIETEVIIMSLSFSLSITAYILKSSLFI